MVLIDPAGALKAGDSQIPGAVHDVKAGDKGMKVMAVYMVEKATDRSPAWSCSCGGDSLQARGMPRIVALAAAPETADRHRAPPAARRVRREFASAISTTWLLSRAERPLLKRACERRRPRVGVVQARVTEMAPGRALSTCCGASQDRLVRGLLLPWRRARHRREGCARCSPRRATRRRSPLRCCHGPALTPAATADRACRHVPRSAIPKSVRRAATAPEMRRPAAARTASSFTSLTNRSRHAREPARRLHTPLDPGARTTASRRARTPERDFPSVVTPRAGASRIRARASSDAATPVGAHPIRPIGSCPHELEVPKHVRSCEIFVDSLHGPSLALSHSRRLTIKKARRLVHGCRAFRGRVSSSYALRLH
jgi:hypothetical protein